jgi:CheY-like chemotaxis protein
MEQEAFTTLVREAFAHLDDRPYHRTHRLAALLGEPGSPLEADDVRRRLLRAIEELRPPAGAAHGGAQGRRWECARRYHLEGATMKSIAHHLGVSERQARRDYLAGLDAVAAVLWHERTRRADRGRRPAAGDEPDGGRELAGAGAGVGDIELEAARVAGAPAEPSDVGDALERALATARALAEGRGVACDLTIGEGRHIAPISPAILRQVLLCALTAGLQTPMATRMHARLSGRDGAVEVELDVERAGPGRGHAETRGPVASPLDAARRLVEDQGGELRLEDPSPLRRRIAVVLPARTTKTILVVDDNPYVAQLFRRYLAGHAYLPVQARVPERALELARELRPDAITLDVMMPTLDGWDVLQRLRADPVTAGIPVIVCSVLPERELASALGVDLFLAKPVTAEALLDALERVSHRTGRAGQARR